MTNRDDIIIRPRLGDVNSSAVTRAREERRIAGRGRGKRGLVARLLRRKAAAKFARRQAGKFGRRSATVRAGSAALRGGSKAGGARALANPAGAIVAALVVAGVVAVRIGTGTSFEGMGAKLNKMLLGDMDEQARATMDVRKRLSGDSHLARITAQEGGVNSQILSIAEDMRDIRKRELDGSSTFLENEEFQANTTLDILILRAKDAFTTAFWGAGGRDAIEDLKTQYQQIPPGEGALGGGR